MGHGPDYKQVHTDKPTNKNPKNARTQQPYLRQEAEPHRGHFDIVLYFNFDLL